MKERLLSLALLVSFPLFAASPVVSIATGYNHCVALRADGSVVAWGANNYGQVAGVNGLTGIKAIAAGGYQSLVLKNDGAIAAFGDIDSRNKPSNQAGNIKAIAASGYADIALLNDSTVIVWGNSSFGEQNIPPGLKAIAVAGAFHFCAAIRKDSSVVTWGEEGGGATVPSTLRGVKAIALGRYHVLALTSSGTVVAWGRSGTTAQTAVPNGLQAKAIAATEGASFAVKADGTVIGWGSQPSGSSIPSGLSNVIAVSGGRTHMLALKADGGLVVWGSNNEGQCNIPNTITAVANPPPAPEDIYRAMDRMKSTDGSARFNLDGRMLPRLTGPAAFSRGVRVDPSRSILLSGLDKE